MVNIIWFILIAVSIIFALLNGNISAINDEIVGSANKSIELIFQIGPLIILWVGILKIAEKSGLLNKIAEKLMPILKKLFPGEKNTKALGYIASNIAANALGLGSAATPFGLKAMEELQKDNPKKDTATDTMITFLVLNTSGVTIIPTMVIALRMANNSANPTEIIIPALLATTCSTICGLTVNSLFRKRGRK